jgi:hypothetical protein
MRFQDVLIRFVLEGKSDAEIVKFMRTQWGLVRAYTDGEKRKEYKNGDTDYFPVWLHEREIKALDRIALAACSDRKLIKESDTIIDWMDRMELPYSKPVIA